MLKNKNANISLSVLADARNTGMTVLCRRAFNELLCLRKRKKKNIPMPRKDSSRRLSVIICTMGKSAVLDTAIRSVLNQSASEEAYEVVCVQNGAAIPADGFPPRVKAVAEPHRGLSYARNAGADAAEGEILLYMDDDAEADRYLVERIIAAFEKRPMAAIIGGQIKLDIPMPRPKILLSGKESLWSAYTVAYDKYKCVREQYEFPYGACFAVRKGALEEVGGFPTRYGRVGDNFAGGEETALCFAALNNGWEVGIEPSAFVVHHVAAERFCRRHVRRTIREGIMTSYRLIKDGYANYSWDERYMTERLRICDAEIKKLKSRGKKTEMFYKRCEREAFAELLRISAEEQGGNDGNF